MSEGINSWGIVYYPSPPGVCLQSWSSIFIGASFSRGQCPGVLKAWVQEVSLGESKSCPSLSNWQSFEGVWDTAWLAALRPAIWVQQMGVESVWLVCSLGRVVLRAVCSWHGADPGHPQMRGQATKKNLFIDSEIWFSYKLWYYEIQLFLHFQLLKNIETTLDPQGSDASPCSIAWNKANVGKR